MTNGLRVNLIHGDTVKDYHKQTFIGQTSLTEFVSERGYGEQRFKG